jgi:hypothetical protein
MPRIGFQSVGRSPPWTSVSSTPMSRRVASGIPRISSSDEPSQWIGRSMQVVYRKRYTSQERASVRIGVEGQPGRCGPVGARNPIPSGVSLSRRSKPQLACSKPVSLGLLQQARAKLARRAVRSECPGRPGRSVRVSRRANGVLAQQVASAEASRGWSEAMGPRCPDRPSREARRIVP